MATRQMAVVGGRKTVERRQTLVRSSSYEGQVCEDCAFSRLVKWAGIVVLSCDKKDPAHRLIVEVEDGCENFKRAREIVPPQIAEVLAEGAKLIPLTKGKFAIVDGEDYEELNQYKWCANKSGRTYYAIRRKGSKWIRMHRQILKAPPHLVCDHVDHDGLNNRKVNLRLCTQVQNCRNRRPRKGGTSKYIGVIFDKQTRSFSAKIGVNHKKIWLGRFKSEDEAARVRDRKAIEVHGEFASLNFPRTDYQPSTDTLTSRQSGDISRENVKEA